MIGSALVLAEDRVFKVSTNSGRSLFEVHDRPIWVDHPHMHGSVNVGCRSKSKIGWEKVPRSAWDQRQHKEDKLMIIRCA